MEDTSLHMHDLTVAAHQLIDDWADIQVRGHLKLHPDLVAYRLDLLEKALRQIREAVDAERADNRWGGPLPADEVDLDFNGDVMDFSEHSCDCEFCLCCTPAGFGDEPIVLMTITAADMADACPTCQAPSGEPCRRDGQVVASHPARIPAARRTA
ncbi:zinc finger domain-containing protein [Streptomyces vinaceus]|uniref:zinc finger domain-containing protein n=1 Tax=Streptomyces vinaceus TaxID=1960 RepID=UPI0036B81515